MTKNELINATATKTGMSRPETAKAIDAVIETITDSVFNGDGKVALVGFGTFSLRESKAREGRNPRTGESVNIPASKNIAFKASGKLKVAG